MNKLITWLGIAFAVQLGLAAGLVGASWQQDAKNTVQALFNFDSANINKIEITGEDGSVAVVKSTDGWHLPDLAELPAKQSKVTDVLNKLAVTQSSWPIATTSSSHDRFEVAEENFQRRVALYDGNTMKAEVFLGTSPGFRKVHARLPGEDEVYSVELNAYNFPAEADGWLDRDLLAIHDTDQIQGPDFVLTKQDDDWQFAPKGPLIDAASAELDVDKAEQLVRALSNLRVNKVAETTPDSEAIELAVSRGKEAYTYRFQEADDSYFVSRDDINSTFSISKFEFDKFAGIEYQELVKQPLEDPVDIDTNQEEETETSD